MDLVADELDLPCCASVILDGTHLIWCCAGAQGAVKPRKGQGCETPKPWWEPVLDRVRDWHLGTHRRAGPGALFHYLAEDHETVMRRSAFSRLRVLRCDHLVSLTLDELIGLQYSYAFSSLAVLGDRRAAYERDIRAALSAAAPSGQFTATLQAQVIIGERP